MPLINATCFVSVLHLMCTYFEEILYELDLFALIGIYLTHVVCCIALQRMCVFNEGEG
jgi:hypothetical protein